MAVGWGGYLQSLLAPCSAFILPIRSPGRRVTAARLMLPAVFLVLAVAALLIFGVRESARTNTMMVVVKIAILSSSSSSASAHQRRQLLALFSDGFAAPSTRPR